MPAVEAFYADNNTYVGMSIAALKSIDQAVNLAQRVEPGLSTYRIQSDADGAGSGTNAVHHFRARASIRRLSQAPASQAPSIVGKGAGTRPFSFHAWRLPCGAGRLLPPQQRGRALRSR